MQSKSKKQPRKEITAWVRNSRPARQKVNKERERLRNKKMGKGVVDPNGINPKQRYS